MSTPTPRDFYEDLTPDALSAPVKNNTEELGLRALALLKEYGHGKPEEQARSPLADGMARDGFRALARNARELGLIESRDGA